MHGFVIFYSDISIAFENVKTLTLKFKFRISEKIREWTGINKKEEIYIFLTWQTFKSTESSNFCLQLQVETNELYSFVGTIL